LCFFGHPNCNLFHCSFVVVFGLQPLTDGAWVDGQSGKTMPVVDHRTEEEVLLLLLLPLLCR
jgi:hypothetical protein